MRNFNNIQKLENVVSVISVKEKDILITKEFKDHKMRLAFANIGRRKAIWPLLIEKSFAKLNGN